MTYYDPVFPPNHREIASRILAKLSLERLEVWTCDQAAQVLSGSVCGAHHDYRGVLEDFCLTDQPNRFFDFYCKMRYSYIKNHIKIL